MDLMDAVSKAHSNIALMSKDERAARALLARYDALERMRQNEKAAHGLYLDACRGKVGIEVGSAQKKWLDLVSEVMRESLALRGELSTFLFDMARRAS